MTGNGVGIATNGSINTATSESSLADVSERNGVELLLGLNLHFMSLYKVKDKLGQGSYGTVWTAHPIDNEDETYAVKIIDRTKLKKRESEAVYREVEILQALKGLPHVIPIIDFLAEPRTFYVVQLYAKGGDLFQRLTQRKVYTEKDARDIAITLLETLDSMHTKHSIVHRDLKPENLLLEDSETEKVRPGQMLDLQLDTALRNCDC
jgi:5'-AMP-activated protein kinase catalytic alpha subunit